MRKVTTDTMRRRLRRDVARVVSAEAAVVGASARAAAAFRTATAIRRMGTMIIIGLKSGCRVRRLCFGARSSDACVWKMYRLFVPVNVCMADCMFVCVSGVLIFNSTCFYSTDCAHSVGPYGLVCEVLNKCCVCACVFLCHINHTPNCIDIHRYVLCLCARNIMHVLCLHVRVETYDCYRDNVRECASALGGQYGGMMVAAK